MIKSICRYDEQVEQLLDEAYEQFVVKKEGKAKQRKRAKQNQDDQLFEVWTSF